MTRGNPFTKMTMSGRFSHSSTTVHWLMTWKELFFGLVKSIKRTRVERSSLPW